MRVASPVIPAGYDVAWTFAVALILVALVATVAAVVVAVRRASADRKEIRALRAEVDELKRREASTTTS